MSQIKTLIESIASGKNTDAKEIFESVISEKAHDYLQEYKKSLAASMFTDKKVAEPEEDSTEK